MAKKTVEAVVVEPVNGPEGAGDGEQNDGQLSLELCYHAKLIAAGMVLIIVILILGAFTQLHVAPIEDVGTAGGNVGYSGRIVGHTCNPAAHPFRPAPPPGVSTQQANIYDGANDVQSDIYGRTPIKPHSPC